ncbi:MAG: exodeoxyribonuclease VII large subunit [Oscillospiraceae bacterium]
MIERKALSVTQVNLYIKEIFNRDDVLTDVLVKGELSNFKAHSSGHMYMSLKDETGVMRAVMFRSAASKVNFKPENGMKVVVHGRISVYERDGQYQLYIDKMTQDGVGDLHVAFEKLKVKLNEEGLFAPEHKKPLPHYPKKIGVVTAPTGAAIRDILNILSRRFSYSDVVLYPVLVQGENSAASVAEAIKYLDNMGDVDVMIIGRGGGSIEDLWAFNEEIVARAIYDSKTPIVSAVGHEIDFTISDFVADLRAPTPSAAAELVVPSQIELVEKFNNVYTRLYRQATQIVEKKRMTLKYFIDKPVLSNPIMKINENRLRLDGVSRMFENAYTNVLERKRQNLNVSVSKLDGLSPLSTMTRGFSVVKDDKGEVVKSTTQVKSGDMLTLVVTDGEISTTVN